MDNDHNVEMAHEEHARAIIAFVHEKGGTIASQYIVFGEYGGLTIGFRAGAVTGIAVDCAWRVSRYHFESSVGWERHGDQPPRTRRFDPLNKQEMEAAWQELCDF